MSALEQRLRDSEPRVRATRAHFYATLMDWSHPRDHAGLPAQRLFLGIADRAETTFRDHFAADRYPDLQPCAGQVLSGMTRAAMEVKTLSMDPFVQGHREAVSRLHLGRAHALESLAVAVVTWGLRFRALAEMVPESLPDSVERAVRELTGASPAAESTGAEVRRLLVAALVRVPEAVPDADPAEVLGSLRAQLAAVFLGEDDLQRAARELAAHVGEFMLMSAGQRAHIDPQLRFVLERALRVLRATQEDEA